MSSSRLGRCKRHACGEPESRLAERNEVWDRPNVFDMFCEELGSRDPNQK